MSNIICRYCKTKIKIVCITLLQVEALLTQYVTNDAPSLPTSPTTSTSELLSASPRQVWQAVLAIALCHNVTPVYDVTETEEAQSGKQNNNRNMYFFTHA